MSEYDRVQLSMFTATKASNPHQVAKWSGVSSLRACASRSAPLLKSTCVLNEQSAQKSDADFGNFECVMFCSDVQRTSSSAVGFA